jgi:hypothetical protein
MSRRWPILVFLLGTAGAAPAFAEDGADPQDPMAKVRAQAEKVLRLMREHEDALLKASTAGGPAPAKGPEIPIPDLPPAPAAGNPEGGAEGSGGGTSGGGTGSGGTSPKGEGAKQSIDELLKALKDTGGGIPRELEELMRMIPT